MSRSRPSDTESPTVAATIAAPSSANGASKPSHGMSAIPSEAQNPEKQPPQNVPGGNVNALPGDNIMADPASRRPSSTPDQPVHPGNSSSCDDIIPPNSKRDHPLLGPSKSSDQLSSTNSQPAAGTAAGIFLGANSIAHTATATDLSSGANPSPAPGKLDNMATNRIPLSHALSNSALPYSTANTSSVNVSAVDNNHNSDPAGESIATATLANNHKQSKHSKSRNQKQTSTRTDFFAAKLASAVDDVDSSDSDETFVYENNDVHQNETGSTIGTLNGIADTISVHGSVLAPAWPHSPLDTRPSGLDAPASLHLSLIGNESSPMISNKPSRLGPPSGNQSRKATSMAGSVSGHQLQEMQGLGRPHAGPGGQDSPMSEHFHPHVHRTNSGNVSVHSPASGDERSKSCNRSTLTRKDLATDNKRGGYDGASSVHERYVDDRYSFDEVEDECNSFDGESMDGYPNRPDKLGNDGGSGGGSGSGGNFFKKDGQSFVDTASPRHSLLPGLSPDPTKSPYAPRIRSSTTNSSSKLRSTTSKLFDKKGSQPRRYSIIPNDIDIEDFDDDLIYYDQNIRFPHTSAAPSTEFTPLMHSHKIPHYRSLNLNLHGAKRSTPLQGKRFASTGQPLRRPNALDGGTVGNSQGYPYSPYQDTPIYYDDIAEYDEAAYIDNPVQYALSDSPQSRKSVNRITRFSHPCLNDGTHYILTQKGSDGALSSGETSLIGSFIYTLVSILCILGIGFIMGFVLASTKDLAGVSVVLLDNAIVSQDELVFNIMIEAVNPGWFSIGMEGLEVDVFAKSGFLRDESTDHSGQSQAGSVETVLLGTVYTMDPSISFPGGIFTHSSVTRLGEVKLLNPGKNLTALIANSINNSTDSDNSAKWAIISRNPFDLVVRGVLKYSLPFSSGQRSAVIQKSQYIDSENSPPKIDHKVVAKTPIQTVL